MPNNFYDEAGEMYEQFWGEPGMWRYDDEDEDEVEDVFAESGQPMNQGERDHNYNRYPRYPRYPMYPMYPRYRRYPMYRRYPIYPMYPVYPRYNRQGEENRYNR